MMYKGLLLFIVSLIMATVTVKGVESNKITSEGAWCWFADPRAITYKNEAETIHSTYIGYIDVHGAIKAKQINHLTNVTNEVLIRSWFQPDDHNNPTFLVLPDERIMIFYSRHTDEACFYYRISQKAGDITTLGREVRLETANNTTYPSPYILSDDPEHIYLCWRGINWHPTIARLTLPDENDEVEFNWGPYQILQSQKGNGVRPYAKYTSNRKDKIYLSYTTTHPDNRTSNWLYCSYIDINTNELKDIKGNVLSPIAKDTMHVIETTPEYLAKYDLNVVDATTSRNWLWEVVLDKNENPNIAMVRISDDKSTHHYYHAYWTGNEWKKTFLTEAGGHFHQTPRYEMCYSGGMALDKANPTIVYASVPVDGKYGKVYELIKFIASPNKESILKEQLTFDSPQNNIRPFVISNNEERPNLAWMHGEYYSWIVSEKSPKGYPTAICTNMEIAQKGKLKKKKELLKKRFTPVSSDEKESIRLSKLKTFTIVMDLSIDHDLYFGELLKTNSFSYNLEESISPKPYFTIQNNKYGSTNVLGTADSWKAKGRGTDGKWIEPAKLETFQLVITYEKGVLRSYINGLVDQYVEVKNLSLSEITVGGHKGAILTLKVFNGALLQDDILQIYNNL